MDKLYKTIDEQLAILEKRKITIGNRKSVRPQ